MDTEGYCVDATVGLAGVNVGGAACLVEANGNQQVGFTFTVHGEAGVSTNAARQIGRYFQTHVLTLASPFQGSISAVYQTSNANLICQLGGPFRTKGGSLSVLLFSASYTSFTGVGNNISGNDFGVGFGFGVGGINVGPGYENTIYTTTFTGSTKTAVADIITGLNLANPVHWLAGPLGLY